MIDACLSLDWLPKAYLWRIYIVYFLIKECKIDVLTDIETKKPRSKIEKVPRGIRGEKSSKDMASSRNLVSTIGALASPKMGDGTRCPEG